MVGSIGSNFDVAGIVAELMKKESKQLNKYNQEESVQEVKLSLYGQFKSLIELFKTNVKNVKEAFKTISYSAASSDPTLMKAAITSNENVFPAEHTLNVSQIAKAESRASTNAFSTKSDELSLSGTLTFTVDSVDFNVAINPTDTLEKIRDRINVDSNNNGVTANIIASTDSFGNDEYTLVVSSNSTGEANAVTIGGDLESAFDFSTVLSTAQDAEFTFNGKNVVRSSNEITDVIDGISFTLISAGSSTIKVSSDKTNRNGEVKKSIQNMVNSYNQVIDLIDRNMAERIVTDSSVSMLKTKMTNLMSKEIDGLGSVTSLFDMGIKVAAASDIVKSDGKTYKSIGKYEINESRLDEALNDHPGDLENFFADLTSGFVHEASSDMDLLVGYGGLIPTQTKSISEYISRINQSIGREESKLEVVKKQLTAKYASLGALMDKFDQLSGYLDSTFSNMNFGSKK